MLKIKCSVTRETFFKAFWVLFLLEGIITMTVYFLNTISAVFTPYLSIYKIALILQAVLAGIYIFVIDKKVYLNKIAAAFLLFLPVGMVLGIIKGQLNTKYLSHMYFYIMPIMLMSFGYAFYREYERNENLQRYVKKIIFIAAVVSSIYVLVFTLGSKLGLLRYNNFGVTMGSYAMTFYLCGSNLEILMGYLLIVINIMTKKRVVLVASVALLIIAYFIGRKTNKKVAIHLFLLAALGGACIYLACNTTVFSRILTTISGILGGGKKDLYAATGGRDLEIECIVEYLNSDKMMWLWGIGFGGRVWIKELYRHYSHFSPLAYVMTGGIFFSAYLYISLIWYAVLGVSKGMKGKLRQLDMPYVLLLCYFVLTSLSGPNILSTPLCWFVVGANVWLVKDRVCILKMQNRMGGKIYEKGTYCGTGHSAMVCGSSDRGDGGEGKR